MRESMNLVPAAYDEIAASYDEQWSVHMSEPQARLTRDLQLAPGARCADLGCGSGIETLDMARLVRPGEVVGIDPSQAMLAAARTRAAAEGLTITTVCEEGDAFLNACEAASFDVISLRFCLAYLDWRDGLPKLGGLLRKGGRIGILTNLSKSAGQAYQTYESMVEDLGLPHIEVPVPATAEEVCEHLARGGLSIEQSWSHSFRMWFASGREVANWLQETGLATHPRLRALPPQVADALWQEFARRIESYREAEGIPLDLLFVGIVARADGAD